MEKKDPVGVIHGRFQMLHKGHMEYLLAGKERCEKLIIGISNPDAATTRFSGANPHRSEGRSNPLTYFERMEMIVGAMVEVGVKREDFEVVPFPINCPELIANYVPMNAKFYMTLYDAWSEEKKESLEALGCEIEVMWRRRDEDKFTSGTVVRERIRAGEDWKDLVPPFVYQYIRSHGIDQRLRGE